MPGTAVLISALKLRLSIPCKPEKLNKSSWYPSPSPCWFGQLYNGSAMRSIKEDWCGAPVPMMRLSGAVRVTDGVRMRIARGFPVLAGRQVQWEVWGVRATSCTQRMAKCAHNRRTNGKCANAQNSGNVWRGLRVRRLSERCRIVY